MEKGVDQYNLLITSRRREEKRGVKNNSKITVFGNWINCVIFECD